MFHFPLHPHNAGNDCSEFESLYPFEQYIFTSSPIPTMVEPLETSVLDGKVQNITATKKFINHASNKENGQIKIRLRLHEGLTGGAHSLFVHNRSSTSTSS